MVAGRKVEPRDYYDFFPPNTHRTGDIWRNLPTFGMLGQNTASAIVITPACDLANRKCETLTYVPVIPIAAYVNSPPFFSEIWQEISSTFTKLKVDQVVIAPDRFECPSLEELDTAIALASERAKKDDTAHLQRLALYRTYIANVSQSTTTPISQVSGMFGKGRFRAVAKRIITNAHRGDIHFLPADRKPSDSSAVPTHSVALFRYPLTIPVQVLDLAQMSTTADWRNQTARRAPELPVLRFFDGWPIRMATLKDDFLADMISRYVAMHIRLGSRDFTHDTIDQFAGEVDNA